MEHGGAARRYGEKTNNEGHREQQFLFGAEPEPERFAEKHCDAGDRRDGQPNRSQYRSEGQVHTGLQAVRRCRTIGGQSFWEKDECRDYNPHNTSWRTDGCNAALECWRECLRQRYYRD